MSPFKNFDDGVALIMRVHGEDVEVLNPAPEGGIILNREERKYLSNRPENRIFHLYHTSGIYRCVRSDDIIVCVNVTDLIESEEREHRENVKISERYQHLLKLNDLVIHDIKNYVFVLDGLTSLMEEGEMDASMLRDLRRVVNSIIALINKSAILLKSKENLRITEVNIEEMVENVIRELSVQAREKEIKIETSCSVKEFRTDTLFREVIFNLLSNAIQHTPRGGRIEVGCKVSGKRMTLWVRDNGPGVPDEMKMLIFERLKSANSAIGMGLGLAVCKHIVELLQGRIWVEDNEPKGAVFLVEIPAGK